MKRLTLVVGQRRSVLVAGTLLILACEGSSSAPPHADDAQASAPDGALPDASVLAHLDAAGAPDAAVAAPDAAVAADAPPKAVDAAADGYKSRDAWSRDVPANAPADAAAPPPAGGPPAPWLDRDIGMVARAGDTAATPTAFTVTAGGGDVGGTADSFHFLYQPLAGDGEIVARVGALNGAEPASKAGVMFRASLEADAPAVMLAMLGDAATGGRLQVRSAAGTM